MLLDTLPTDSIKVYTIENVGRFDTSILENISLISIIIVFNDTTTKYYTECPPSTIFENTSSIIITTRRELNVCALLEK